MKITKIYFPMVTVMKLEVLGQEDRYFTLTEGETYPSEDVILTNKDWRRALSEARQKGSKVEEFER